jgi:GTP-binding protein YchF
MKKIDIMRIRMEGIMKLGIVGLPNVGKSTLFNAITNAGAEAANYPFCTIEPNMGVVPVPDERLNVLAKMYNPVKVTPAVIDFVDIAGLVRGASKGEGLGNKFLSHIREVDAIVHVTRCFEDTDVIHVEGSVDPLRDIETINLELIFADLETLDRRIDRSRKLIKGDRKYEQEVEFFERVKAALEAGLPARSVECTPSESVLLYSAALLTAKPVIYAANLSEADFKADYEKNANYIKVAQQAEREGAGVLPICAKLEEEISTLEDDEKAIFLEDLGLEQSGLDRLVKESYSLLGLISYLTAGQPEVRAWTITRGMKAPQAAGKIHSDFERGFIRAEVVTFSDLIACGSLPAAKEKGLVRSEGKEYVMQDGDVVLFRFNV